MIEIKTEYEKYGKKDSIDINCKIDGRNNEITMELTAILKCLYDKFPELFMDALELNMKDIFDEVMTVRECFEEGGDDD